MTYEVHLRETQPQPAASVRGRAVWADIGSFIQKALMEVFGVAGGQGTRFAGPAFAIYHSVEATEARLDCSAAIAEPIEPVVSTL